MLEPGSGTQAAVLSSGPSWPGRSQGRCRSPEIRAWLRAQGPTQPACLQGTGLGPLEGEGGEPMGQFPLFPQFSHL